MKIINKPISDNDTLIKFYNQCIKEKILAIDTEFVRETTYYPSLCLIQIAGSDFAASIDPLSGIDLSPIWKLLSDKNILKVFHAARQDIEIFFNLTGEIPFPIYDTQIASMFCGLGDQIGYEALVNNFLDIQVNKQFQFTNWLQRPLSKQQIEYAISDVTHLIKIYPLIDSLIIEQNRKEWVDKEMSSVSKKNLYQINSMEIWKKIKIKNAKPHTLNYLKYLAAWRENECKESNIPRNRLIRDESLINIAFSLPQTVEELKKTRIFPKNISYKQCEGIIDTIAKANKVDKLQWPLITKSYKKSVLPKSNLELVKLLLKVCSEESGLAERIIADADDIRNIFEDNGYDLKLFHDWRNDIFGKKVKLLLEGKIAFTISNGKIKQLDL